MKQAANTGNLLPKLEPTSEKERTTEIPSAEPDGLMAVGLKRRAYQDQVLSRMEEAGLLALLWRRQAGWKDSRKGRRNK